MDEVQDYAGMCPACGGTVFMETTMVFNEIQVDYYCGSCNKTFSTL